jgi:hypothetical protein
MSSPMLLGSSVSPIRSFIRESRIAAADRLKIMCMCLDIIVKNRNTTSTALIVDTCADFDVAYAIIVRGSGAIIKPVFWASMIIACEPRNGPSWG